MHVVVTCDRDGTAADFSGEQDVSYGVLPGILFVENDQGVIFAVRLVRKGDRYGLHGGLTHDQNAPLVEFYDTRYDHIVDCLGWVKGMFVSRCHVETLLNHTGGMSLGSLGHERYEWCVNAKNMAQIKNWLRGKGELT